MNHQWMIEPSLGEEDSVADDLTEPQEIQRKNRFSNLNVIIFLPLSYQSLALVKSRKPDEVTPSRPHLLLSPSSGEVEQHLLQAPEKGEQV